MTLRQTPRRAWLAALLPLAGCASQRVECLTVDMEAGLAWRSIGESWRLLGTPAPASCAPPALPPPPLQPGAAPMRS